MPWTIRLHSAIAYCSRIAGRRAGTEGYVSSVTSLAELDHMQQRATLGRARGITAAPSWFATCTCCRLSWLRAEDGELASKIWPTQLSTENVFSSQRELTSLAKSLSASTFLSGSLNDSAHAVLSNGFGNILRRCWLMLRHFARDES